MNNYLAVAKAVNTHGIKGEIKAIPLTSDISRFDYLLYINAFWEGKLTEFRVLRARYHKNFVILKLQGIDTMNDALKLKGQDLLIERKYAIELDEDEYFICDMIDVKVYEDNNFLGSIIDVLETGSNDVYVIKTPDNKELLLPALKSVVLDVDIGNKKMYVKVPEGLNDI
jgi:16S rRNA processing protein RimM